LRKIMKEKTLQELGNDLVKGKTFLKNYKTKLSR